MTITDFNVAVVEGDEWLSKWIREQRTLLVADGFCRLFKKYIPHHGFVVDIGTCLGDHTASYSAMVGPNGLVHGYEPNPEAFECLVHNMMAYPNVRVHNIGLGATPSSASVIKNNNLGASQIKEDAAGGVLVSTLDREFESWGRCPDFIKIDAEGWEYDILLGGRKMVADCQPVMLIELNRSTLAQRGKTPDAVISLLHEMGYSVKTAEPHHTLALEQVDVLCLPKR